MTFTDSKTIIKSLQDKADEINDLEKNHEYLGHQETVDFADSVIMDPKIKPYSYQLKSLYK